MEVIVIAVAVAVNVVTAVGGAADRLTRMMIAAVVVAKCNVILERFCVAQEGPCNEPFSHLYLILFFFESD